MPKKKGAKRPTKKEQEARQALVDGLFARGFYPGQIKRLFSEEFACDPRTAEAYITRARETLREALGLPEDEHRMSALAIYQRIVQESVDDRVVIQAQKRIDRILGNEAAIRLKAEFRGEFRTVMDLLEDEDLHRELESERENGRRATRRRKKAKGKTRTG